jgi:hypothetical protein
MAATRVVWKYSRSIGDVTPVKLPGGAELLHVADQEGFGRQLDFWFLVDPEAEGSRERAILVVGTGVRVEASALEGFGHLATVVTAGGALVWHVFLDHDGARAVPVGS